MKKIVDIIQVIFAYGLILSILNTVLFFVSTEFILIIFIVTIIFVKVTPHPTNHLNPFAFDSHWRIQS